MLKVGYNAPHWISAIAEGSFAVQIFLSYKREDELLARNLHGQLMRWGYLVWLDVENIQGGENWDDAIHQGLRASEVVVGLLTPESLASGNVRDEWGYALSTGKRLLLLWMRDIDELDMPARYIRLQRIDCRTNQVTGFTRLQTALASASKLVPENIMASPASFRSDDSNVLASGAAPEALVLSRVTEAISKQSKTNRERMLDKVNQYWVQGVLEQSLHGAALLALDLAQEPDAVTNPWDAVLQHSQYGDYRLPSGTHVSDVFHDLNGQLLILGDPGSGKTTMLVELASELIDTAIDDSTQLIPVIFNLSSWADERKPISDWMVNELHTKYQTPRKTARRWVESEALLPMLDGLDEVDGRYRDACVLALNAYREEYPSSGLVVCSRVVDYQALSNRLKLNGAVVLQPLTGAQIDGYFEALGEPLAAVRSALRDDATFRELAQTPLMLSIMTLAYQGLPISELPRLITLDAHRQFLFSLYVKRMFEWREATPATHPAKTTIHYLSWLAGQLVRRKQTVFYIENLQLDWLDDWTAEGIFRLVHPLVYGLGIALIAGVFGAFSWFVLAALTGRGIAYTRYARTVIQKESGLAAMIWLSLLIIGLSLLTATLVMGIIGVISFLWRLRKGRFSLKLLVGLLLYGVLVGALGGLLLSVSVFLSNRMENVTWYGIGGTELSGLSILVVGGMLTGIISVVGALIATRLTRLLRIKSHWVAAGFSGFLIAALVLCLIAVRFDRSYLIFIGGISALILAVTSWLPDQIESAETLTFKLNRRWYLVGLGIGLAFGIGDAALNSSMFTPTRFLGFLLTVGIPVAVGGAVAAGLRRSEAVEVRIRPNQGMRQTASNALKIALIFAIAGPVITTLFEAFQIALLQKGNLSSSSYSNYYTNEIQGFLFSGFGLGLAVGLLLGGGDAVAKHLLLRYMLWRSGAIPWNYARFLDHATERILLRKVGGGYVFVHRMLLEYFVELGERLDTSGDG